MGGRVTCNDIVGASVHVYDELTVYAVVILTPPVLFLLFLLWKLRSTVKILRETSNVRLFRSSALAFLWLLCFVNITRVAIQVLIPPSLSPIWKICWLLMRFMLMFCQAAVAAFIFTLILHDASFEQIISSLRADRVTKRILTQTFVASTLISVFDLAVQRMVYAPQAVMIFGFDEGIYSTTDTGDVGSVYWIVRSIVFIVMYLGLLLLLRLYPPVRGSTISESSTDECWWYGVNVLNTYCWALLFFNILELVGWIFIFITLDAGDCVIGLGIFLYYSVYPPLVYLVFMAKFFQPEEHWPLSIGNWSDEEDDRRRDRQKDLQDWMAAQERRGRG